MRRPRGAPVAVTAEDADEAAIILSEDDSPQRIDALGGGIAGRRTAASMGKLRNKSSTRPRRPAQQRSSATIRGGEVFCIRLGTLGACTGVISRPPNLETNLLHVYLRLELTRNPIKPNVIGQPHTWPAAWIGLVTAESITDGRWPIIGRITKFDRDAFPIPPTRHAANRGDSAQVFSVETTADEPSTTALENVAATKTAALRFPPLEIVIGGSALEDSLERHFRHMRWTFHSVRVSASKVTGDDVAHWNSHARHVRARIDPATFRWLPAGRKTDRQAKPGDWFGFPLPGGGFGAAILVERPTRHMRFFSDAIVMSMRRRWTTWPSLDEVRTLRAEDGAILSQMSFIAVRDGRWRALGPHPAFETIDWPWPLPWFRFTRKSKQTEIRIVTPNLETHRIDLDPKIIALDPQAGQTLCSVRSADAIAFETYESIEGTRVLNRSQRQQMQSVVTPKRLRAWKVMNAAIIDAAKRSVKVPASRQ